MRIKIRTNEKGKEKSEEIRIKLINQERMKRMREKGLLGMK